MKKIINIAILFLIFGMFATSCKKDKADSMPLETALESILSRAEYSEFDEVSTTSYELGFSFSSSKNGKISKLGLKLPENGTYEVSLWDFDSETKLDSVMVTNADSSKFNYASISARSIVASKKYVVSVNTANKNYFCANQADLMPYTSGSITVHDQREASFNEINFPKATIRLTKYCGLAGFIFQAE